jgi:hypothetical protein
MRLRVDIERVPLRDRGVMGAMIVSRSGPRVAPAEVIVCRYGCYTTKMEHNEPYGRLCRLSMVRLRMVLPS